MKELLQNYWTIFLLVVSRLALTTISAPCFLKDNPFLFGGTSGDTQITAMDLLDDTLYLAGSSEDSSFGGSTGSSQPFIAKLKYTGAFENIFTFNDGSDSFSWPSAIKATDQYVYTGFAGSPMVLTYLDRATLSTTMGGWKLSGAVVDPNFQTDSMAIEEVETGGKTLVIWGHQSIDGYWQIVTFDMADQSALISVRSENSGQVTAILSGLTSQVFAGGWLTHPYTQDQYATISSLDILTGEVFWQVGLNNGNSTAADYSFVRHLSQVSTHLYGCTQKLHSLSSFHLFSVELDVSNEVVTWNTEAYELGGTAENECIYIHAESTSQVYVVIVQHDSDSMYLLEVTAMSGGSVTYDYILLDALAGTDSTLNTARYGSIGGVSQMLFAGGTKTVNYIGTPATYLTLQAYQMSLENLCISFSPTPTSASFTPAVSNFEDLTVNHTVMIITVDQDCIDTCNVGCVSTCTSDCLADCVSTCVSGYPASFTNCSTPSCLDSSSSSSSCDPVVCVETSSDCSELCENEVCASNCTNVTTCEQTCGNQTTVQEDCTTETNCHEFWDNITDCTEDCQNVTTCIYNCTDNGTTCLEDCQTTTSCSDSCSLTSADFSSDCSSEFYCTDDVSEICSDECDANFAGSCESGCVAPCDTDCTDSCTTVDVTNYTISYSAELSPSSFVSHSMSASSNLSLQYEKKSWCDMPWEFTGFDAISDMTCQYSIKEQLPLPNMELLDTATCDDLDQIQFKLFYNSAQYSSTVGRIELVNDYPYFRCYIYSDYLTGLTRTYTLQAYTPSWMIEEVSFKVHYRDPCESGVSIASGGSGLEDFTYMINSGLVYYPVPVFNTEGEADPAHCYINASENELTFVTYEHPAIVFQDTNQTIRVGSVDYGKIGDHIIQIVQHFNYYEYSVMDTITITFVDDCIYMAIVPKTPFQTYYDIDSLQTVSIYNKVWSANSSYCNSHYPMTFDIETEPAAPIFDYSDPSDITIYTEDVAYVGDHVFYYHAQVYNNSDLLDEKDYTFTVHVTNNCPTATINTTPLNANYYYVGQSELVFTFDDWTITEYSYCKTATYVVTQTGGPAQQASPQIYYSGVREFTVFTEDTSTVGTYTFSIVGTFSTSASTTVSVSFEIRNGCFSATLSYDAEDDRKYTLQDARTSIFSTTFYSSESGVWCGDWVYSFDFGSMDTSGIADVSSSSPSFSIESSDYYLTGFYDITVTAHQGTYTTHTISYTFTLEVYDPCSDVQFEKPFWPDITYSVAADKAVVELQRFNDSLGICGDFEYMARYRDGSAYNKDIFRFNFNTFTISIFTANETLSGDYDFTVRATLPYDYGYVEASLNVQVVCIVYEITSPTPSDQFIYRITQDAMEVRFLEFEQYPLCGYEFKYYLQPRDGRYKNGETTLPAAISFSESTQTIKIYSDTEDPVGYYDIVVNGTLQYSEYTSDTPLRYQITILNHAPYFVSEIENVTMTAGDGEVWVELPEVENPQGGSYEVSLNPDNYPQIKLYGSRGYVRVKPSSTEDGILTIQVVVTHSTYSQLTTSKTWIVTIDPAPVTSNSSNSTGGDGSSFGGVGDDSGIDIVVGEDDDDNESENQASSSSIVVEEEEEEVDETVVENDEDLEQDEKLQAKISQISKKGVATIKFDQSIATIDVTIDEEVLRVEVVPGPDSDEEKMGFSWKANETGTDYFNIQLDFENPLEIAKYDGDYLRVTFLKNKYFRRKDANVYIEKETILTSFLPTILSSDCKFLIQLVQHSVRHLKALLSLLKIS